MKDFIIKISLFSLTHLLQSDHLTSQQLFCKLFSSQKNQKADGLEILLVRSEKKVYDIYLISKLVKYKFYSNF